MPARPPDPAHHPYVPAHHPYVARFHARVGTAALRRELLRGASGRVIEIGAGNGPDFAHYPRTVSEVVVVEPERGPRRLAAATALRAGVPVDLVPGAAEALPVKSEAFDVAVASLALCRVRDPPRALAELYRVLRPDGALRFLEHGLALGPGTAAVQRALDRTVWPRLFGGCHTARDPLASIEAAGFRIVAQRAFRVPERGPALPDSYRVVGTARRSPD
ncbi:methyltransferase domain-containing protein [Streptomyces sp. NPDC101733]|uniref:class I SAM-dependent methyltransferase n=1 Tax=unclassified Streptomyces TaxID=2593676 RepID=UPI003828DEE8